MLIDKGINVTNDIVIDILKRRFPKYEISEGKWGGWLIANNLGGSEGVIMKKSGLVHVHVAIQPEDPETGKTEIIVSTDMNQWLKALLLGGLLGSIIHYIAKGDIDTQVEIALRKGLVQK